MRCQAPHLLALAFPRDISIHCRFNVYVAQPEVKPGCVLRQSNVSVLEKRKLVNDKEVPWPCLFPTSHSLFPASHILPK